jgi:hypothetical protein
MAAVRKVSLEDRREIGRRRAAGESCQSIALEFPIGHQRVSSICKEESQRGLEEQAGVASKREEQERREVAWNCWVVSFDPKAKGAIFIDPEHRDAYYCYHSGSERGGFDYNDVFRFSKTPPAERRALDGGRPLYLCAP